MLSIWKLEFFFHKLGKKMHTTHDNQVKVTHPNNTQWEDVLSTIMQQLYANIKTNTRNTPLLRRVRGKKTEQVVVYIIHNNYKTLSLEITAFKWFAGKWY